MPNSNLYASMAERRQRSTTKTHTSSSVAKRCHLCEPLHVFSKPSSWPSDTLQWVEKLCSQRIPPDAVVCRACENYIKRHRGKSDMIPRWLPTKSKAHRYCMVEGCGKFHTPSHQL